MTELAKALETVAQTPDRKTVFDLIARQRPEIEKALPAGMDAVRFERIVRTAIQRVPKLLECDPAGMVAAVMLSAQLGLEPGPLGHVYLVPFGKQVEFVVGYKGYIDLAYRSGQVKDVHAAVVYEGDAFDWREGTRPYLDHSSSGPPAEREWTHVYAVARLRTGGCPFTVLYPEDVEKARKRSASGAKGQGPWVTDAAAMWRKTAVRRLAAFLPQSPVFARGLERDESEPELDDVMEVEA